ncbi:MAG: HAMP domain-containing sensor histidine kinase [Planctomycetota bacterium]
MTVVVLLGIPLLAGAVFYTVAHLQKTVQEEQGRDGEEAWCRVARDHGIESLEKPEQLSALGLHIDGLARGYPRIIEFFLVRPDRTVVHHYLREGAKSRGQACALGRKFGDRAVLEHPAPRDDENPIGCMVVPIQRDGILRASIILHTDRDWAESGQLLGSLIDRTAWSLLPPFGLFYLGLATLLVLASRKAREWRERAAATERLEVLRALAAGINHEIRNPLNTVALSMQYLERRGGDHETQEVVRSARAETDRIRDTLQEFVGFTRLASLDVRETDLGETLRAATRETAVAASKREVELKSGGDAIARVDGAKLAEAYRSVLGFLVEHSGRGGDVTALVNSTRSGWQLVARANPVSLDEKAVERLFDPYVRTTPNDVGRGLALARAVLQVHGGDLVAFLEGTTLIVRGRGPRAPGGEKSHD